MTSIVLAVKVGLDGLAAIGLAVSRNWPMALMFFGFVIADLGALWIAFPAILTRL